LTALAAPCGTCIVLREGQTEAAQAVIDAWDNGHLAGAMRTLAGFTPAARAVIAKAKGGAA
jgi:hypothetical protein